MNPDQSGGVPRKVFFPAPVFLQKKKNPWMVRCMAFKFAIALSRRLILIGWKTKGFSAGGGGAQGLLFSCHEEQASVVYWYLPPHNIHKHEPRSLLVMSFPALCKTKLDAIGFHAATLHWAYARLFHEIFPVWNWTVVVFGATVSCFSVWNTSPPPRFQQTFCGMQPLTW